MRKSRRTIVVLFLALALGAIAPRSRAGIVTLNDGAIIQGVVLLTSGEGNIPAVTVQAAGKPLQTFKLADLRTAIFDTMSSDNAASEQDYVPWARAEVGETRRPRIAEIRGRNIIVRDGTEALRLGADRAPPNPAAGSDRCFIFQKLEWDGEIVARVLPSEKVVGARSGLMICEGLDGAGPAAFVTRPAGSAPGAGATLFLRPAHGEDVLAVPRATAATSAPAWVKLRRSWDTVRAFESSDGQTWLPLGECRVEMDDKKGVYIGVIATGAASDIIAIFENVHLGGRRTAAILPGATDPRLPDVLVTLRDGTILAGLLQNAGIEGDARIKKIGGELAKIPVSAIAGVQFAPLSREDEGRLSNATPGALTVEGDFLEGEIKDVKIGEVTVSSVNFGLTTIPRQRLIAVTFQPPTPRDPALLEVRIQDGSLLAARDLVINKDQVTINEPLMGPVKVPLNEIISVTRRK